MHTKILFLVLLGACTGATASAAAPSSKKSTDCAGAWTGTITYTRTQSQSDTRTVERVSGRGTDTRTWEMKLDYKASVVLTEAPTRDGSSIARATINHSFTTKETNVAVERNSCDRGKTWQDMMGTFTSDMNISGSGKEEASVSIGLNSDGTYAISVSIPQIEGTMTGSERATYSGQCTPKKGKDLTLGPSPTRIEGQSLSSDGSHHVDPGDPNRLSGTYSLSLSGDAVETISWNLQRCGAPLRLIDLKFEDMKVPTWDAWQEISEQRGTVDGNWVKIRATVLNASGETKTGEVYLKETYKGDHWDGARPDAPLKDQTFTVTLEPGEEREIEMLWDSSGYAWYDDGRPRLVQRVKAEVWENYKKVDELTRNVKVQPKPIVFVPGIWTEPARLDIYQNLLTTGHSYGWKACPVIDTSAHGTIAGEGTVRPSAAHRSVYEHADNLHTYVDAVRSELNAWHVDMLGHSTGGLVARLYIHKQMETLPDNYPVVKHLMLAGTPNNGMPCADSVVYNFAFSDHPQTAKELLPDAMALFNQYVTQRKGTIFSALAGDSIPTLCGGPQWSDGYVSVESATYGIEDTMTLGATHNDLLDATAFTTYVRPHVVTGPRGTYPLAGK